MSDSKFKPGDVVSLKAVAIKGEVYYRMVVEMVLERGMVEHILCSYSDEPWTPGFFASSSLEHQS